MSSTFGQDLSVIENGTSKQQAHLASEYHDLFQKGKILHNREVLPYDSTIPIKEFEKKIRIGIT
jgi:hypothetical protein